MKIWEFTFGKSLPSVRVAGVIVLASFGVSVLSVALAGDLDDRFKNPPESTKPWCYWYWLNGQISKESITKDLENMARVGIRRAFIGNVSDRLETGKENLIKPVVTLSSEWMALTRHAMSEGNRVGVDIYMFNCPGWSQSGGPWIKEEQSMRRVTWNEIKTEGGFFSGSLRPEKLTPGQDIAVLAVPRVDHVSIQGVENGDSYVFFSPEAFTARSLRIDGSIFGKNGKLYAIQDGQRSLITEIVITREGHPRFNFLGNMTKIFSFKDVRGQRFELVLEDWEVNSELIRSAPKTPHRIVLTSEPGVAEVDAKQLGRLGIHEPGKSLWESYVYRDTVEPDDPTSIVRQDEIIDLTDKLEESGNLRCTLPPGKWSILYFGMVSTGVTNHPVPPEARGLEVDKMSKKHIRHHFNGMFGEMLQSLTPEERAAFKGITIDSFEVGGQNWTDDFAGEFEKRNGYDLIKLLPVMTGRVIGSVKTSDQFLWDFRRTIADMIAENYVGGLREVAHENGLKIWCENYHHFSFPSEFLMYGGYSDEIGGEFWVNEVNNNFQGNIESRAASSSGHVYGKKRIYGEAFTSVLNHSLHPYSFKARGEAIFCDGINHFVLHVCVSQLHDEIPGLNPWFGTAFHRNTPWFNESRDWVKYLQRCHTMLQEGEPVADVAVYIGDFAPQITGPENPVPAGYDYDYIGSDAILRILQVRDGEWVVPDENDPERIAARYKLLAIPEVKYIRPKVLKRLEALKEQGGRIVNPVPVPPKVLSDAGITPLVSGTSCPIRWKVRRLDDGMIFFLSNFTGTGPFEATLRVKGKAPELFDPVSGTITRMARYQPVDGGTKITFNVRDKSDSFFVVCRSEASLPSVVKASASPAGLELFYDGKGQLTAETGKAGRYLVSLSDGTKREVDVAQGSQNLPIKGQWQMSEQGNPHSVLYETSFDIPSGFGKGQKIFLDLGEVAVMAKVTLNGTTYDTLWMPPFSLDVTEALKTGRNDLKVQVTSTITQEPRLGEQVRLSTRVQRMVNE